MACGFSKVMERKWAAEGGEVKLLWFTGRLVTQHSTFGLGMLGFDWSCSELGSGFRPLNQRCGSATFPVCPCTFMVYYILVFTVAVRRLIYDQP